MLKRDIIFVRSTIVEVSLLKHNFGKKVFFYFMSNNA